MISFYKEVHRHHGFIGVGVVLISFSLGLLSGIHFLEWTLRETGQWLASSQGSISREKHEGMVPTNYKYATVIDYFSLERGQLPATPNARSADGLCRWDFLVIAPAYAYTVLYGSEYVPIFSPTPDFDVDTLASGSGIGIRGERKPNTNKRFFPISEYRACGDLEDTPRLEKVGGPITIRTGVPDISKLPLVDGKNMVIDERLRDIGSKPDALTYLGAPQVVQLVGHYSSVGRCSKKIDQCYDWRREGEKDTYVFKNGQKIHISFSFSFSSMGDGSLVKNIEKEGF